MNKSIIIIGAGMGGLSAGCHGQMNGYNTQIFEMHTLPGGQCASWKRKGYTFDACIHYLFGCSPSSKIYQLWHELVGAFGAVEENQLFRVFLIFTSSECGLACPHLCSAMHYPGEKPLKCFVGRMGRSFSYRPKKILDKIFDRYYIKF